MEQIITVDAQEKINELTKTESHQYLKLVRQITSTSNEVITILRAFRANIINENSLLKDLPDSIEEVKSVCGVLESTLNIEAIVNYDTKQIRLV